MRSGCIWKVELLRVAMDSPRRASCVARGITYVGTQQHFSVRGAPLRDVRSRHTWVQIPTPAMLIALLEQVTLTLQVSVSSSINWR